MGYKVHCHDCGNEFFPQWWKETDRDLCPFCMSDQGEILELQLGEFMEAVVSKNSDRLKGG